MWKKTGNCRRCCSSCVWTRLCLRCRRECIRMNGPNKSPITMQARCTTKWMSWSHALFTLLILVCVDAIVRHTLYSYPFDLNLILIGRVALCCSSFILPALFHSVIHWFAGILMFSLLIAGDWSAYKGKNYHRIDGKINNAELSLALRRHTWCTFVYDRTIGDIVIAEWRHCTVWSIGMVCMHAVVQRQ